MQERLNKIMEDFKEANNLKREIESKEIKTQNDLEELEIIQNWLEELKVEINGWANEYNSNKNLETNVSEDKTENLSELELLTQALEENSKKLNEIKRASQSLQPKFTLEEKNRKHEILDAAGFVLTKTADNRDIRIHPTLVGQYYDLTKERKQMYEKKKALIKEELKKSEEIQQKEAMEELIVEPVKEFIDLVNDEKELSELDKKINKINEEIAITNELKEEIESKDIKNQNDIEELEILNTWSNQLEIEKIQTRFDDNQQRLSEILAGKGMGKKDYITFDKSKYWIPKKNIAEFIRLMKEQKTLSKEITELTNISDKKEELFSIEDKTVISTNSLEEQLEEVKTEINEETKEDIFEVIKNKFSKGLENLTSDQVKENSELNSDNKSNDNQQEKIDLTEKQLPILYEGVKKITPDNGNMKNKVKQGKKNIIKSIIELLKNTTIYKKYKEYLNKLKELGNKNKESKVETNKEVEEKQNRKKELNILLEGILPTIEELTNKKDKTKEEEEDLQRLLDLKKETENELEQLDKKSLNNEVKDVRKSQNNIKEKTKKNSKKLLLRLAIIAGLGVAIVSGIKSCNKNAPSHDQIAIGKEVGDLDPDLDLDSLVKDPIEKTKEETFFTDDTQKYNIDGPIYGTAYDATNKINSKKPYFGEETTGYITGWVVTMPDGTVRHYNENNQELQEAIKAGGAVTAYSINDANSEQRDVTSGYYNAAQVRKSR